MADGANLDLTVLGAGPAYTARPGALGASYLVRHGDDAIVLDLGQGVFANLAGAIEPSTLRAIAISHLHPDHFVDLVPLRHYLKWDFEPPRRVEVLAPAGLADRLDALHAEPGFTAAALDVTDLDGDGTRQVGPFTLEARRVEHTEEGYGFRVTAGDGPGLVYSGDCGDIDDLRPLVREGLRTASARAARSSAACSVLCSSIATVSPGPTSRAANNASSRAACRPRSAYV